MTKRIQIVIPCRATETASTTLISLGYSKYRDFETTVIMDTDKRGAQWARNEGWRQVKDRGSEFVIFSDNDLRWYPYSLGFLVDALDKNPEASYAYGGFRLNDHIFCNAEFNEKQLKVGNYIHTSALIRTAHFPGYDESIKRLQDWDLWLNMLINYGRVGVYCGQEIYASVQRAGGISVDGSIPLDEATYIVKNKYHLP